MITNKAKRLSKIARGGNFSQAKDLYDEIINNCHPTKEEFSQITLGVIMRSDFMWDFVLYVPKWEQWNKEHSRKDKR